jgi:hypothetical protein
VHALNILKLLFLDAILASDLEHYLSVAMQAAVLGFRSDSWAVRNSSMMVFAVITSRFVTCVHHNEPHVLCIRVRLCVRLRTHAYVFSHACRKCMLSYAFMRVILCVYAC